ncbi:hypothetical protein CWC16_19775, partial [Pseudoalteromonas sp. S3776]|uniref:AMP-binding protein n=1 Tax=Pseudoalteromonas sp. S3776 TaxID=579544 RepID=UPI0011092EB0
LVELHKSLLNQMAANETIVLNNSLIALSRLDGQKCKYTNTSIDRLIVRLAQSSADSTALISPYESLTFAEVKTRSDRFIANMQSQGLKRGQKVLL